MWPTPRLGLIKYRIHGIYGVSCPIVVVGRTLNTWPLNAAVSYPLTSDYTQAKPDLEYITQD